MATAASGAPVRRLNRMRAEKEMQAASDVLSIQATQAHGK
ncbi:MAG: hypothetical protein JWP38_3426 [Herbaspirillum sp.]|nr:hypothetical protein [Herbaspirillum sp.]